MQSCLRSELAIPCCRNWWMRIAKRARTTNQTLANVPVILTAISMQGPTSRQSQPLLPQKEHTRSQSPNQLEIMHTQTSRAAPKLLIILFDLVWGERMFLVGELSHELLLPFDLLV
jgi:hypothetical protein